MKILKLFILWLIVVAVMVVCWPIGTMIGNALTSSVAPPPPDAARAGLIFLAVCAFNSMLITLLLHGTRRYAGMSRSFTLTFFVFAIQFLLPQLESYFFASGMGMSNAQVTAILIAGVIVCPATIMIGVIAYHKLLPSTDHKTIAISFSRNQLLPLVVLVVVVYPFLYMTFGYFIAWQNENLRIYYTSSSAMAPYSEQLASIFGDGLYFLQLLRGVIWIVATAPIALMLGQNKIIQYLLTGILCALLPSSLLLIPNPYMPSEIAITHLIETATSNFVWGLAMVWVIRRNPT
jgi:hypothetical protein